MQITNLTASSLRTLAREMRPTVKALLGARALHSVIKEEMDQMSRDLLRDFDFRDSVTGERITEGDDLFMTDDDTDEYFHRHRAYVMAHYPEVDDGTDEHGSSPDLVLESEIRAIEEKLIGILANVMPIYGRPLTLEIHKRAIDLCCELALAKKIV